MRNYTLYLIYLYLSLFLFASCSKKEWTELKNTSGRVTYRFQGSLLEEQEIVTRAIDPDGKAIRTFWLFCFDENGLFLERAKATIEVIDGETQINGTFTADIPATTGIIHYLVNVNLDNFEDRNYLGTTESYVISPIISTSGRLTYWRRGTVNINGESVTPSPNPVVLYRSQAMVSATSDTPDFQIIGIAVCNKWLNGTVAPFKAGGNTDEARFSWTAENPFITYHGNMQKETNPTEVTDGQKEEFIFEHNNNSDDPIYVILKGESKQGGGIFYYKLHLIDTNKHFYDINRNYRYNITVKGDPGKWCTSFSEAESTVPINNPLFNIDPSLPSISSGQQTLQLTLGTTLIVNEDNVQNAGGIYFDIPYTYREYSGSEWSEPISATSVEITQNDNFITSATIINENKIRLTFNDIPNKNIHIGKITIWGGKLSRSTTIYYGKKFTFSPVFMTDKIIKELHSVENPSEGTLTFTVPDNYPTALFPVNCRIYAPKLNPMETLTVVQDENGYGYLKQVDAPGTYTVIFKNISTTEDSKEQKITLRAHNFEDVERSFTYVDALEKLQTANELILAPKTGVQGTFNITSVTDEEISIHSRFYKVISAGGQPPTGEQTDAISGITTYSFQANGTNTTVIIESKNSRAAETLNITGATSASTTLKIVNNPGSYDFGLRINNSTTTEVGYLPGSTVTLTFDIPNEAWVDNAEFYLYAGNLSASTGNTGTLIPNPLGFSYKPVSPGIQTLYFTTNTVTSAETVTLLPDASVVSFNEDKVTYTNTPITGTVTYDGTDIPPSDFVAMERGDGLRVGKLVIGAGGTYTLTFYPDYKLNVTDEIIFTYTQNDNVYQHRITVQDLCFGTPALRLTKITS